MGALDAERFRQGRVSLSIGKKSLSVLLTAGVLALAACSDDKAPEQTAPRPTAAQPVATQAPASVAEDAGSSAVVSEALTVPELLKKAEGAVREKQLFVPPGQSAFDYYLRVLELAPDNRTASNALIDFTPYALLYVEQRVAADDLAESERVLALVRKADDKAPALPRLQRSVAALRTRKADEIEAKEQARLAAQQRAATAVPAPIAASEPVAAPPVVQEIVQETRPPVVQETPSPIVQETPAQPIAAAAEPKSAEPPPQPATPPAQTSGSALAVISSVQPNYPKVAMRNNITGYVEVGFTVLPDGGVSNVRVISSKPTRVFDREAINAMERWRFAPGKGTSEGRQTFNFELR